MRFKKTRLAKGLSAAIGALTVAPLALGQTESGEMGEEAVLEVINVVGSRAALERAMDVKRDNDGIVDGISAEDIGKFPDTNLAESLQRITGVAISRSNGEGSQVTVRGMGPDRNMVTLNGRTLARTTGSRAFDFGNIASEMVTAVSVYKTSDASVPTGGIGATIDMITNRPLDNSGKASISAKGLYDESSADPSVTPEISGIYSGAFELENGGEFGVSIAASYAERESGNRQSGVGSGWRSFEGYKDQNWDGVEDEWGAINYEDSINHPCPGQDTSCTDIYSSPQSVYYKFEEQQRERFNGQLVLQWAPNEDMTATLDYNYYDNKIAVQSHDVSTWFNYAWQHAYFTEEEVSTPIIYKDYGTADLAMGASDFANRYTGDSIGFNFEWQVNDSLALEFDAFTSDAERTPDSIYGSGNVLTAAAFIRESTIVDFTEDMPALAILGSNALSQDDMLATGSVFNNNVDMSTVDQFRFEGVFDLDDSQSIEFGVAFSEITNHSQSALVQRDSWGGVGTADDYDDSLFIESDIYPNFNSSAGDFSEVQGNDAYSTEEITALDYYYQFSFGGLIDQIRAAGLNGMGDANTGDCGDWYCPSSDFGSNTDQLTTEATTSVYAQYKLDGVVSGMNYSVMLGLRYENTDVDSTAYSPNYDDAAWVSDNETQLIRSEEDPFVALSQSGGYDYLLPNLSARLEITDELVGRFAYSETIGRPNYNDIKGGTVIGSQARANGGSGSSGNPNLLPLESENFDVSFEYYYGEGSYASLGFFWKDLSNFIGSEIVDSDVFGLPNPQDGMRYEEARAALGSSATSASIRQWIFDNYGDTEYVDVDAGIIYGDPATDNTMNFEVTVPSNSDVTDEIDGMEFAVQHFFGESGFGAQANYTMVNSSYSFDNSSLEAQYPVTGISDTANLVGFYEMNGFSARLAYNWRDEYLMATGDGTGANPQYVEEYYQLDFNLSYEFAQLEGFQILLEGYNLTDQNIRIHSRTDQMVLNVTEGGPRWVFGARYAF